jgi:hypothetical protein
MSDQFKDNGPIESEDLFDFPDVQGFSPEFIEAARLQTEAANSTELDTEPAFENLNDEDFIDDFADDFSDLMGEPLEEAPQQEEEAEVLEPATAIRTGASTNFDFRFVWGALALLFTANLVWAWTWHNSESRLRGEMDQRFQSFLAQQKSQLTEAMDAFAPVEVARSEEQQKRIGVNELSVVNEGVSSLDDIKRDLMHSRYETARAKAWRLIARVDSLPITQRAHIEASARLLIAESYEVRSTETLERAR